MCSACHLMVFNVYVKFHENMSSGFKVMQRTRKLLTDTHTQRDRKDENIIPPWHTLYAGGIINKFRVETGLGKVKQKHCLCKEIHLNTTENALFCLIQCPFLLKHPALLKF